MHLDTKIHEKDSPATSSQQAIHWLPPSGMAPGQFQTHRHGHHFRTPRASLSWPEGQSHTASKPNDDQRAVFERPLPHQVLLQFRQSTKL